MLNAAQIFLGLSRLFAPRGEGAASAGDRVAWLDRLAEAAPWFGTRAAQDGTEGTVRSRESGRADVEVPGLPAPRLPRESESARPVETWLIPAADAAPTSPFPFSPPEVDRRTEPTAPVEAAGAPTIVPASPGTAAPAPDEAQARSFWIEPALVRVPGPGTPEPPPDLEEPSGPTVIADPSLVEESPAVGVDPIRVSRTLARAPGPSSEPVVLPELRPVGNGAAATPPAEPVAVEARSVAVPTPPPSLAAPVGDAVLLEAPRGVPIPAAEVTTQLPVAPSRGPVAPGEARVAAQPLPERPAEPGAESRPAPRNESRPEPGEAELARLVRVAARADEPAPSILRVTPAAREGWLATRGAEPVVRSEIAPTVATLREARPVVVKEEPPAPAAESKTDPRATTSGAQSPEQPTVQRGLPSRPGGATRSPFVASAPPEDAPDRSLPREPAPADARLRFEARETVPAAVELPTSVRTIPARVRLVPPPIAPPSVEPPPAASRPSPEPPQPQHRESFQAPPEATPLARGTEPIAAPRPAVRPVATPPVAEVHAPASATHAATAPLGKPAPEPPATRVGLESLAEAIVARAQAVPRHGAVVVRFVLEPEELGTVRVHIESRGDDVKIRLVASTGAAMEALGHGLARIGAQLTEAGFRHPSIDLGFDDSSSANQSQTRDDAPGRHAAPPRESPAADPSYALRAGTPVSARAEGRLDRFA